ncbi:MAG: hypothetical protein R3B72_34050 [Polyangiaceae bacterium]
MWRQAARVTMGGSLAGLVVGGCLLDRTGALTEPAAQGSCGDGVVDPGESCDGAGETATCDLDCTPVSCGDGLANALAGEACDDGNSVNDDACRNDCTLFSCGNGTLDEGEECDDGNQDETDACTNNCLDARCGDGKVQAGEACDDGNGVLTDACLDGPGGCVLASCGDGYQQDGVEGCDDMNDDDSDDCVACQPATCGDGALRTTGANPEICDDGNLDDGDGCDAGCAREAGACCSGEPGGLTLCEAGPHVLATAKMLNVTIPDNAPNTPGCVTINFDAQGCGLVTDVDVEVAIHHSYVHDVSVYATHGGTKVDLLARPGDALNGANLREAWPITYDDEAQVSADEVGVGLGGGTTICFGVMGCAFIPDPGSLSGFDGATPSGDWTLCAFDSAIGDEGRIGQVTFAITTE